jgi:putative membrane protein
MLPNAESHFSWLRTRLSVERTLMSWVRTSTALIGFGFTIVQFFQHLSQMQEVAPARHPGLPWYLGLGLIAAGVLGTLIAVWQYRMLIRYLWENFKPIAGVGATPERSPLLAVAALLTLIGVAAFVAVITRAV